MVCFGWHVQQHLSTVLVLGFSTAIPACSVSVRLAVCHTVQNWIAQRTFSKSSNKQA